MSIPRFFRQPLRYLHWASIEKPAIFYSIVVGSIGPVMVFTVPPIRRYFGDGPKERIPLTYPNCLAIISTSDIHHNQSDQQINWYLEQADRYEIIKDEFSYRRTPLLELKTQASSIRLDRQPFLQNLIMLNNLTAMRFDHPLLSALRSHE
ncbi:MAG: hypothetical protein MMC33_006827 [Icmadophila ericetorum]|nr:hypothetical protein [Icmadophila ericetorum]